MSRLFPKYENRRNILIIVIVKIKISVTKIRCARTTNELTPDEIYFAVFLSHAKIKSDGNFELPEKPFFGRVSEVKENVKKDTIWRPMLNDLEVDLGTSNVFSLLFGLYEQDNGKTYNQLQAELSGVIKAEKLDWKKAWDLAIKIFMERKEPIGLIAPCIEMSKLLFKHFGQDDLIGQFPVNYEINDPNLLLPREFEVKGFGGKYDIGLQITLV